MKSNRIFIKEKLQELMDQNIIEAVPIDARVTWISPMMPVEKGKGRIPKAKGISGQQRQASAQK